MKRILLFVVIFMYACSSDGEKTTCCDDDSCKCTMCRLEKNDYRRFCEIDSDSCDAVIFKIKFKDMKAQYDCEGPLEERVCDDTIVFTLPLFDSLVIKKPVPKNREGKWICK